MIFVGFRIPAGTVVLVEVFCGKAEATTGVRQDKNPHIASLSVGCFVYCFPDFPHIAASRCDVRPFSLSSDFSANRTSQAFPP